MTCLRRADPITGQSSAVVYGTLNSLLWKLPESILQSTRESSVARQCVSLMLRCAWSEVSTLLQLGHSISVHAGLWFSKLQAGIRDLQFPLASSLRGLVLRMLWVCAVMPNLLLADIDLAKRAAPISTGT
jgi:hypothetical protein